VGVILLFYKYVTVRYPKQIQKWQKRLGASLGLTGRIIIAAEGINGTVGGSAGAIAQYKQELCAHELFVDIDFKESAGEVADFPRLSVMIKPEIVSLGIDPARLPHTKAGRQLTPDQAHELLKTVQRDAPRSACSDLVILDGRNNYESAIGAFEGAIKPDIEHFRDFPQYIDEHIELFRDKTVVMYCTGGVRCERASAYLQEKGVAREVLQIAGGIHRYIEQYPNGFFRGKNYVFDKRVSLAANDDILSSCMRCNKQSDRYQACVIRSCKRQLIVCASCSGEVLPGSISVPVNSLLRKQPACAEHAGDAVRLQECRYAASSCEE
jgi:predicted sulfurtransferase